MSENKTKKKSAAACAHRFARTRAFAYNRRRRRIDARRRRRAAFSTCERVRALYVWLARLPEIDVVAATATAAAAAAAAAATTVSSALVRAHSRFVILAAIWRAPNFLFCRSFQRESKQ